MIPPQMMMESAAEHARQLRRTNIHAPVGSGRSATAKPARAPRSGVRARRAAGRRLIRMGVALAPSSPRDTAWS